MMDYGANYVGICRLGYGYLHRIQQTELLGFKVVTRGTIIIIVYNNM